MSVNNTKVDVVDTILNVLREQFETIISSDRELYSPFKIVLTNEQQYVKERDSSHNVIYIVVKFSEGTKDNGQLQQPVLINAVGENNSVNACQRLLHDFAQRFTVDYPAQNINGTVIRQAFSTPMIMQNFNNVTDGYRSLFYMSGIFFVGFDINLIEQIEWFNGEEWEKIPFLNSGINYSAQVDPRATYGTNNFTRSVATIRTLSLSMTVYNTTSAFNKKVLGVMYGESSVDTIFNFKITYSDEEIGSKELRMRLVSTGDTQQIRAFPARALTFTQ